MIYLKCEKCGEKEVLDVHDAKALLEDGRSAWCMECSTAYHTARMEVRERVDTLTKQMMAHWEKTGRLPSDE